MRTVWKIIIVIIVLALIYLVAGNLLNFSTFYQTKITSSNATHISTDGNQPSVTSASEKAPAGSTKPVKPHPAIRKVAVKAKPNVES